MTTMTRLTKPVIARGLSGHPDFLAVTTLTKGIKGETL